MAIDFKTFIQVAEPVVTAGFPIMLRGRHGIGKSQVVYQTADKLGLPVVERRASQMTEGDLIGLPSTDGDVTSFNPPDWFAECCRQPRALFLDEVDRATQEVRQGIFELTDSRKLNGHTLHPDTRIFAAVNGGEECAADYQVGEMDPAELDRWTVFDVAPSVEDWLSWATDKVDGIVWDFVNNNRNHLEHNSDIEPNKVYPSRRSWERFSITAVKATLLGEASPVLFNLASGFVGFEAAVALNDFVLNYDRQVTPSDILDDGKVAATSDFDINEHSALIEKMEASEVFKEALEDGQVANLADYFVTLPSECAMKLWTVLGAGEVNNTIKLHQAQASDGQSVSNYLVELLTGTEQ